MIRALSLILGLDKIKDWNAVPAWLAPLELNSEILAVEDRREMKANTAEDVVMSVQPKVRIVGPKKRPRRSIPSPYLR
jgi:hypothetical protein